MVNALNNCKFNTCTTQLGPCWSIMRPEGRGKYLWAMRLCQLITTHTTKGVEADNLLLELPLLEWSTREELKAEFKTKSQLKGSMWFATKASRPMRGGLEMTSQKRECRGKPKARLSPDTKRNTGRRRSRDQTGDHSSFDARAIQTYLHTKCKYSFNELLSDSCECDIHSFWMVLPVHLTMPSGLLGQIYPVDHNVWRPTGTNKV